MELWYLSHAVILNFWYTFIKSQLINVIQIPSKWYAFLRHRTNSLSKRVPPNDIKTETSFADAYQSGMLTDELALVGGHQGVSSRKIRPTTFFRIRPKPKSTSLIFFNLFLFLFWKKLAFVALPENCLDQHQDVRSQFINNTIVQTLLCYEVSVCFIPILPNLT